MCVRERVCLTSLKSCYSMKYLIAEQVSTNTLLKYSWVLFFKSIILYYELRVSIFGMKEMYLVRRPQHLLTDPQTVRAGKSDILEQSFEKQ